MIPLNFRPFNDMKNKYFNALNHIDIYNRIDIQNARFDDIHILDDVYMNKDSGKLEWNYNTILLAQFKNDLEAGNIGLGGMPINNIKVKKRKKEDMKFDDIKIIPYENDKFDYEISDRFVESIQNYVYALQPMGGSIQNPILGNIAIEEVYCEFDSTWLLGLDEQYQLIYNLEVGDYETVIPQEIIETIGSQYPFVISNGSVKYRKGSIKAMIVSNATAETGEINKLEEKKQRQAIMKFLTNKKPKIYKDGSGQYMLVSVLGTPVLSPNNNLGQLIYDIGINFIEVGSTDTQTLVNNGLAVL